ncbi:MAG: DegV family protein [Clostridia bacterium]|nr:DegV family protein [Clostridia bacterium]
MRDYIIFADSACDIKPAMLEEWGVRYRSLTLRFEGSEQEYLDGDIPSQEFYNRMRAGEVAKTAAVNTEAFAELFESALQEGKDVLYLGFSTGLSTTYNSARIAAQQLKEKYPEAKILTVDSLAASAGFGLLLYLLVQKKKAGATVEEAAAYAEDRKLNICHWFTVDDLVYLKRGGRISPMAAFAGNLLGIKPVLHVDNEGHLINVSKVRGRKTALSAMADRYGELALDSEGGTVFISHGDCMGDVEMLSGMLKTRYGADVKVVTDVGTVIGAHAGPGVLALFFEGKER